jgi:hypothetical protein
MSQRSLQERSNRWLLAGKNSKLQTYVKDFPVTEEYPFELVEGTALTSLLVDFLHGQIQPHSDQERLVGRLDGLFHAMLGRTKNRLDLIRHLEHRKALADEPNDALYRSFVEYHLWHEICSLRRILARIRKGLNTILFKRATNNSKHGSSTSTESLRDLENVLSEISSSILKQARSTFSILKGVSEKDKFTTKLGWHELAILYESTLILRSRGKISLAETYAKYVCNAAERSEKSLKKKRLEADEDKESGDFEETDARLMARFDESLYMPSKDSPIKGMVPFNPQLFSKKDGVDCYLESANLIFGLSWGITLNSTKAAVNGMRDWTGRNHARLANSWGALVSRFLVDRDLFQLSSYLHIESTLRVLVLNLIPYSRPTNGGNQRKEMVDFIVRFYNEMEDEIENMPSQSPWISSMINAKIQQDGGMLLSNIMPEEYLRTSSDKDTSSDEDSGPGRNKIMKLLKQGWDENYDCPARLKNILQRAIFHDLIQRSERSSSWASLREMRKEIGDPSTLNPLHSTDLTRFLWGSENKMKEKTPSRHLKHFPQGNVNRAQIVLSMAYMQALMLHDESLSSHGGLFGMLQDTIRFSEDDKNPRWMLTDRNPKPQFTLGFTSKKMDKHLDAKGKKSKSKRPPNLRGYLKRVNRMDSMMYLATSLNLLEELISKELGPKISEQMLNESARLSFKLPFCRPEQSILHVHDVIHAAQEISQSPMWLTGVDEKILTDEGGQSALIDQVLRAGFVRLSLLVVRTEQLARVVSTSPLREPYISSASLILDQIRVLLKYLITNWRKSSETFCMDSKEHSIQTFDNDHFDYLNKRFTKNKGHPGMQFSAEKYKDRGGINNESMNDLALNYLASTFPSSHNVMSELMGKLHSRLEFNQTIGEEWNSLIISAIPRMSSQKVPPDEKQTVSIEALDFERQGGSDESTTEDNNTEVYPTDSEVSAAFDLIRTQTDREWILWARLAFFPLCLNGRILQSGTTFKELNEHITSLEPTGKKQSEGRSLLWGNTLNAYNKTLDW